MPQTTIQKKKFHTHEKQCPNIKAKFSYPSKFSYTSNSHDFITIENQKSIFKIHPTMSKIKYNAKFHKSSSLSKLNNLKQFKNSKWPKKNQHVYTQYISTQINMSMQSYTKSQKSMRSCTGWPPRSLVLWSLSLMKPIKLLEHWDLRIISWLRRPRNLRQNCSMSELSWKWLQVLRSMRCSVFRNLLLIELV